MLGQSQHPGYKGSIRLLLARLTVACYQSLRLHEGVSAAGPQGCSQEEPSHRILFFPHRPLRTERAW